MPENPAPQRFRVPRDDRSLLMIPDLVSAVRLVKENQSHFAEARCSLNGRSLADLRAATRLAAVSQGRDYTASLIRSELPDFPADSVVVSGHQPDLFHVGVWAKNFTLAGIARQCNSIAINLVIDNDAMNSTTLRVPAGTREQLRIERLPFDSPRQSLPWEEAMILDGDLFRSFGPALHDRMRTAWGFEPLAATAWSSGDQRSKDGSRLCDELTAIRTRVERNWGLANLELPMSRLCNTEPFRWFAAHLLMRLPEVHQTYNEVVAGYRHQHRLRNRMQPLPDLDRHDDWLEAPFWIWRRGDSQRGRLFARRTGSVCELRDQSEVFARLPFNEDGSLHDAVTVLDDIARQGFRLRTRALTTTLFARTCLADLFVHGIGGAKYDSMTDRLCERLFGITAPAFMTVSATLYLPLGGAFSATEVQLHAVQHRLRDLDYNPDRHLTNVSDDGVAALVEEKKELLESARTLRATKKLKGRLTSVQHRRLDQIRSLLRSKTDSIRADYQAAAEQLRLQLAANAFVRNREYSFVLYPEGPLREFLMPLAETPATSATLHAQVTE